MGHAASLLKETVSEWSSDRASRLAAALAFYTTFSIAPLLVIVIALTSPVFGEEPVRGQIERELGALVGEEAAAFVLDVIARGRREDSRGWASVVGILALFFGATGAFAELRGALKVYYSAQILLLGAEFTEVYARRFGSHRIPVESNPVGVLQES